MAKTNTYVSSGFLLLSGANAEGLKHPPVAATISIKRGDAIHADASGYATNAVTALTSKFLGIAAADVDNSSGLDAALTVPVIPPVSRNQFIVPVGANAVITQAAVGTVVDLEAANTIDISDVTVASGPGFKIDEIDVSATAVAINTYGYAIGHFEYQS